MALNDTAFNSNWTNQGSGESWVLGATDLEVPLDQDTSKRARRNLTITSGKTYNFNILGTLASGAEANGFDLRVYLGGSQLIELGFIFGSSFDVSIDAIALSNYTYFEIEASTVGHDTNIVTITDVIVYTSNEGKFLTKLQSPVFWEGYPALISAIVGEEVSGNVYLQATGDATTPADLSGQLVHFDLNQITIADGDEITLIEDGSLDDPEISETLTIEVREPCENPIMLMGRNSLGGVLQWLFEGSQEYRFDYGNGVKAKRLVLYTDNLTLNQWEALQDFITLGEVYNNNITEFTSGTIKTSTRIGQQLYVSGGR